MPNEEEEKNVVSTLVEGAIDAVEDFVEEAVERLTPLEPGSLDLDPLGDSLKEMFADLLESAEEYFPGYIAQRRGKPPVGTTPVFEGRGYLVSLGTTGLLFLDDKGFHLGPEETAFLLANHKDD